MAKIKTRFEMEADPAYDGAKGAVNIIGKVPENKPYLSISFHNRTGQFAHGWIADKDIERFAVNILKSIGSKKLKP